VVEQVVAKTDGVPLFVEELTKMVLESALLQEREERYELTGPLPPLAIPATLHDSLMARLDRLATVKTLAQLGATLGREFSYDLLHTVSLWDEATVRRGLHQLVEAEFLYQQGLPPQATYLFKHALIQEAAYQSLLRSTRQQYHQRIAQVLEARFPELCETQPELLAHHYTEAGVMAQAIPYWQRAGERAIQHSAHLEATGHLTRGLDVLKILPDTLERAQQELTLQITLGVPLLATKGFGAPEVERVYARARALCHQVGETPQLFSVLWGIWWVYENRAALQTARELAEQLLTVAQRQHEAALLLQAHRAMGQTMYWFGELTQARAHLEQGIALYDPQQHRSSAFLYGQDPGVGLRNFVTLVLWFLGYPDQAVGRIHEAVALAQEVAHPFSLAFALSFVSWLHHYRREGPATQGRAEAAMALCREHGFAFFLAQQTVLRGWALAEQGHVEEGIAQMRQGLAAYKEVYGPQATGAEGERPYLLALFAEAYGKVGQPQEGLRILDEALTAAQKYDVWDGELYRVKGELLLTQAAMQDSWPTLSAAVVEVETCFRQALDMTRRQQAKSLELRATMSLSRLWQLQGKRDDARELLAPVYGWFTEGFETADLREAKALLAELGS
jgi:predicted ATPase